jgi:spore germination cell wall hydrolase CwlJ-like protein
LRVLVGSSVPKRIRAACFDTSSAMPIRPQLRPFFRAAFTVACSSSSASVPSHRLAAPRFPR